MRYLVSGGSGFLGTELIKKLIVDNDVVVISRNEGKLTELKERFPKIEIVVGDVSDIHACRKASIGVDGIFHLAAMKHVGLAEENVKTCIDSNVIGTMNLLDCAIGKDFIIGISTDKAAQVKGVYGASKLLMERLFAEYEKLYPGTKFRIVRYGNVLYSTGSVLCKWKDKLLKGEEITVTDLNATRFFWTVESAVNLIFECLEKATNSTPYITKMKSMRMGDLLEAMMNKYGKSPIKTTGLQKGENMHEMIVTDGKDSSKVERYTTKEIMELI